MNYVLFGTSFLISFLISILFYILNSWSYYTISKNRGYHKPWLAWVPVASDYLRGAIADDIGRYKGKLASYRILMVTLSAVVTLVTVIAGGLIGGIGVSAALQESANPSDGFGFFGPSPQNSPTALIIQLLPLLLIAFNFVFIAYAVVKYIVLYKIFEDYVPQNAVVFLLLSIFITVTSPFLLFSIKNKSAVSIHGRQDTEPKWDWIPPRQSTEPFESDKNEPKEQ